MARIVDGDTVIFECTFSVSGTPTDPTTITLKVKDPSGSVSTYTTGFTNPSTGVYQKTLALSSAGMWYYRWVGTGTAPGVEEGSVRVVESNVE